MGAYVLDLTDIDRTHVAHAGGKGANLGELTRIEGIHVPPGYVVTTAAYQRIIAEAPALDAQLDRLARQDPDDRDAIRAHSAEIRRTLETIPIPDDLADAITRAHARLGERTASAVRSSATAEDQPTTSFAGQHDSYLHVRGAEAVLDHVRRCWASLHTERAIAYRQRNGIGHHAVHMAVVVQRMVAAEASGILFTADPVTGNRTITTVEATHGLADALVAGRANADAYRVRSGEIVERTIGAAQHALHPALTDAQVRRLAELGRRIEAHFGSQQDVEWCLEGDRIHVVQSRPITTLYPVPETSDGAPHVYLSVGHQQMMTDPMKPLGLSFWQMTAARPMAEAGGRLFVDVTRQLASPASRAGLVGMIGKSDPLIGDALRTVIDRGFIPTLPDEAPPAAPAGGAPESIETDPAIVHALIARTEASLAAAKRDIRGKTGPALLDGIHADVQALKRELFDPRSHQAIMAGIEATGWLNERLEAWLGETNAADVLTRSAPHNVTSEMGLALLDVADAVRPHPEVVAYLRNAGDDGFLDALPALPGGTEARDAIRGWLERYGMRCPGEIDITRPRWSERPGTLVPLILANVANFAPGEAARRFERGRREAEAKERELLERLRALPDGERKAGETKRMIDRVRTFIGYREYPKYGWMARYFVYRRALIKEAARLARAGVIREAEDVYWLTFAELHDVVRTHRVDAALLRERRDAFRTYETLTPPRVLTSDGEMVAGAYRRGGLPDGALVGLAVSAGTVEGRARVVLDMADARLEPGDILVTAFTDPSWTPLFVAVAGLVTEVGGLMTHGAVIAREYGLPAVVGVEGATRQIRNGQRIRVHGTEGYVEILT